MLAAGIDTTSDGKRNIKLSAATLERQNQFKSERIQEIQAMLWNWESMCSAPIFGRLNNVTTKIVQEFRQLFETRFESCFDQKSIRSLIKYYDTGFKFIQRKVTKVFESADVITDLKKMALESDNYYIIHKTDKLLKKWNLGDTEGVREGRTDCASRLEKYFRRVMDPGWEKEIKKRERAKVELQQGRAVDARGEGGETPGFEDQRMSNFLLTGSRVRGGDREMASIDQARYSKKKITGNSGYGKSSKWLLEKDESKKFLPGESKNTKRSFGKHISSRNLIETGDGQPDTRIEEEFTQGYREKYGPGNFPDPYSGRPTVLGGPDTLQTELGFFDSHEGEKTMIQGKPAFNKTAKNFTEQPGLTHINYTGYNTDVNLMDLIDDFLGYKVKDEFFKVSTNEEIFIECKIGILEKDKLQTVINKIDWLLSIAKDTMQDRRKKMFMTAEKNFHSNLKNPKKIISELPNIIHRGAPTDNNLPTHGGRRVKTDVASNSVFKGLCGHAPSIPNNKLDRDGYQDYINSVLKQH